MVFRSPFRELFFCHSLNLELYHSKEEGTDGEMHPKLLVKVMEDLFRSLSPKIAELRGKDVIDEKDLWTLFPPGSLCSQKWTRQSWCSRYCLSRRQNLSCFYSIGISISMDLSTGFRHASSKSRASKESCLSTPS
ncbi:hypothetical protein B0H67DRAFT_348591 [Lasiosphaeris hirsuta]|uniref:Uncharacterized protein n=1 Tax=Lasiosphaeris hirsuta TaxID=260670 RepID=A0AA39ZVM9_9PEZI|nr:hypothetical protein B0H67DRAFT_348591 [Lasiosphaeris hirsuta]